MRSFLVSLVGAVCATVPFVVVVRAHEETRATAAQRLAQVEKRAKENADLDAEKLPPEELVELKLRFVDDSTGKKIPCLVRITNASDGKALRLKGQIHRAENFFSVDAEPTVTVPRRALRIEALRGLETELASRVINNPAAHGLHEIRIKRFSDVASRSLRTGNTHLHLRGITWEEMDRYLRLVPRTDELEVVFVSHLRRANDDRNYISNQLTSGDLGRLSQSGILFGNGEEHRHNFGPGGEGYGHVMFLNLQRLIEPVSIGPGIMQAGTDGRPLRTGIQQARRDGATVIWCHNRFGLEDVPNWLAGTLDAQNIHDGGPHGSYGETYYRYLNLGLRVPFSTGTDWFVYDFSRVYVPLTGELTVPRWLDQLRAGRSTITNGPLLEFSLDEHAIGDVVQLDAPRQVRLRGRGQGRTDFVGLELIRNGEVVKSSVTRAVGGHFETELVATVSVDAPAWFALRIPLEQGKNEFGQPLFAHTSPIYCDFAGGRVFQHSAAEPLLVELRRALEVIPQRGTFANDGERDSVLNVYRDAIQNLESRMRDKKSGAKK